MKHFFFCLAIFLQLIGMGLALFGLYEGVYEAKPMEKMTQEIVLGTVGFLLFFIGTKMRSNFSE
ncbi:hypothetical protein IT568_05425 [bacterium]|nr:hypothetical protein [bacterium]